jgi:ABC-2 type transport system permease protein
MKTMKWLLRREFWEHKGAMFWAPVVAGALMVMFIGGTALYGATFGNFHNSVTRVHDDGKVTVISTTNKSIAEAFLSLPAEQREHAGEMISSSYLAISAPLFAMLAFIAFFYCLGAMNEERRDRSILFWKSLPISDAQTVLSKVITAALVAPLITIAVGTFVSLLTLLIVGVIAAFNGISMFGNVLTNTNFYLAPLQLLGMLPIYVLWALPTIGWLLMVSAWARNKVFLWAVGTPLLTVAVIKYADFLFGAGIKIDWVMQNIVARCLLGLVPGGWLPDAKVDPSLMTNGQNTAVIGEVFKQSWLTLSGPSIWIGAIAGAAMIIVAIRLRRWKDEG